MIKRFKKDEAIWEKDFQAFKKANKDPINL